VSYEELSSYDTLLYIKRGEIMVELDRFKNTLSTYKEPLKEVGDSL